MYLLILVLLGLTLQPPLFCDLLLDHLRLLLLVPVYLLDPLPAECLGELDLRAGRDQPLLPVLLLNAYQVSALVLHRHQQG